MKFRLTRILTTYWRTTVVPLVVLSYAMNSYATPIQITGVLIDEPCTIVPSDGNINVDFGEITDRSLYNSARVEQPFYIELDGCNSSLIKTLTVKFLGNSSSKQPGLLALDSSSQATGIAIGIEHNGRLVPINNDIGVSFPYANGSETLAFNAYVQADPDVTNNKSIGLGRFTATATFVFEYE